MEQLQPWLWVELTAGLDASGRLPTDIHHRQTRGAHPAAKLEPGNRIGVHHDTHMAWHDRGQPVQESLDLAHIW